MDITLDTCSHVSRGPDEAEDNGTSRPGRGLDPTTSWVDDATDDPQAALVAYTEPLIRDYERDPDITGTYEPVVLPAGPATRVWIREGSVNPVAHTEYILQHDGVFYRLACLLHDLRQDDWLSIAEGIEFPSAEE